MKAREVYQALQAGQQVEPGDIRRLARDAANDTALTAEFFRDLVEPLSDSFDAKDCQHYGALFNEVISEIAPGQPRPAAASPLGTPGQLERLFVLSRVTLGADIAVTSVLMDAAKRAFPNAQIVFTGNRKNFELWSADPRVSFLEAPYARTGTLRARIEASQALASLLGQPSSIVIDPDSRLTQLGLVPVCPDDRYYFFKSRNFGGDSNDSLAVLASRWAEQTFGVGGSRPYLALPQSSDEPRVTVSFGTGESPAKRVSEAFEITVLQELVRAGAQVLIDCGAGGEEAVRVQLAVDQTSGWPGQVKMFNGSFAHFAAHIARSPLYIGYDSAGQHAAAALGIPSITVFAGYPNERFLHRWHPTGPGGQNRTLLATDPDLFDRLAELIRE